MEPAAHAFRFVNRARESAATLGAHFRRSRYAEVVRSLGFRSPRARARTLQNRGRGIFLRSAPRSLDLARSRSRTIERETGGREESADEIAGEMQVGCRNGRY